MWERLRQFSTLDSEARGLFLRAAVLLPVIAFSLKTRGLRATQGWLLRFRPHVVGNTRAGAASPQLEIARTQLTARMINAAVRNVWRSSTCLEKSLTLWWLLRRHGVASQLRIGARKVENKFEAHAWVEREGIALNEPEELHRHYEPFDEVPSAQPLETR